MEKTLPCDVLLTLWPSVNQMVTGTVEPGDVEVVGRQPPRRVVHRSHDERGASLGKRSRRVFPSKRHGLSPVPVRGKSQNRHFALRRDFEGQVRPSAVVEQGEAGVVVSEVV